MKKTIPCCCLLALLLLAGCTKPVPPPDSSVPPPQSSSASAASSSSEQERSSEVTPSGYAYGDEVAELFNGVLRGFADGSLPNAIIYHSDGGGLLNGPPDDTTLPERVTAADLELELVYNEMWGTDTVFASLALPGDYTLTISFHTDGVDGAGKPQYVDNEYFTDERGAVQLEEVPAAGSGVFTQLYNDRITGQAGFTDLAVQGQAAPFTGNIRWMKANRFLWIDIYDGEMTGYFYTYHVASSGALVQDYPGEADREFSTSPYSDEAFAAIAADIFSSFQQALEEIESGK